MVNSVLFFQSIYQAAANGGSRLLLLPKETIYDVISASSPKLYYFLDLKLVIMYTISYS